MADKKYHWRDQGIVLLAIQIGFASSVGYWFYRQYNYLDVPVEAREYCEIVGMVAYDAGFARDEEGFSERQHIGRVMTAVGHDLLDDWKLVIEASFNDRSKNPAQLEDVRRSDCLWRFRHGGKSIERDHGRVFW